MESSRLIEVVAEQGSRIAAVAHAGPLQARVPHMRRWTLSDVVAHLGGVHRWAAEIVSTRTWTGAGPRRGRAAGDDLIAWFEDGLAALVCALTAADVSAPCPNFSPGSDKTARFWLRRQAHETTVHRWDAEAAAGRLTPIEGVLATDGIDEVLTVFRRTRGGQALTGPLVLATTDTGACWRVSPADKPGRVEIVSGEAGVVTEPAASVAGPAEALLLALWGRIPVDGAGVQISGRDDVVRAFLPGPGPDRVGA